MTHIWEKAMIYLKDIKIINDVGHNHKSGIVYCPWFNKEIEVDIFELGPDKKLYYHPKQMLEGYHENPGVFLPFGKKYFTYDDYLSYCKQNDYVYKFIKLQQEREIDMISELLNYIRYYDSVIAERCVKNNNILIIDKYECKASCMYYETNKEYVGEYYVFYETNPYKNDRILAESFSYEHPIILKDGDVDNVAKYVVHTISKYI